MASLGLDLVLRELYDSEINFSIESIYDAGWRVTRGSAELGEVKAQCDFRPEEFDLVGPWLASRASEHYPDSQFARRYPSKGLSS